MLKLDFNTGAYLQGIRQRWDSIFQNNEMYAVVDDILLEIGNGWIRRVDLGTIQKQGTKKVSPRKRARSGRALGKGNSKGEEAAGKSKDKKGRKVMGKKKAKNKGKC